jgi:uncharacterized membrane protein (DUF2068 family)
LVLLAVGIGALSLRHKDTAAQVTHWVSNLGVDPDNRYIHKLIRKLWAVDDARLEAISAGTFFYAALMFTEGIGLALRKRWAEYFTIIATSSFIPLELYELAKHFRVAKVVVILVNAGIVVYLVLVLRQRND